MRIITTGTRCRSCVETIGASGLLPRKARGRFPGGDLPRAFCVYGAVLHILPVYPPRFVLIIAAGG